jgi:hypothetical protein
VVQFISSKVDEMFVKMSRDYTTFISGRQVKDIMPKVERQMRAEILRLIEGDGDASPVANDVKKEPDSGIMEGGSRDRETTETSSPGRAKIYEASNIKKEPDLGPLKGESLDGR